MLTTDDDFERAATGGSQTAEDLISPTESVVQKAVQKGTEMARIASNDHSEKSRNTKENGRLRSIATGPFRKSGGHGTRNPSQSSNETAISETGGAESGALCKPCENGTESDASNANFDPEWNAIVNAWQTLSPAIRSAITALVRSAGDGDE